MGERMSKSGRIWLTLFGGRGVARNLAGVGIRAWARPNIGTTFDVAESHHKSGTRPGEGAPLMRPDLDQIWADFRTNPARVLPNLGRPGRHNEIYSGALIQQCTREISPPTDASHAFFSMRCPDPPDATPPLLLLTRRPSPTSRPASSGRAPRSGGRTAAARQARHASPAEAATATGLDRPARRRSART